MLPWETLDGAEGTEDMAGAEPPPAGDAPILDRPTQPLSIDREVDMAGGA